MSATLRRWCADIPSAGSYLARSLERFFHGAKVLQNLRMCKKNRILVRFFWCGVYGVECKGRNLLGGKSPSTKQTSGKCPNTIGGEITIIGNLFRKLVNFLRKWGNLFRKGDNFFRMVGNFFRKAILTKSTFGRRGVESEFSRSSVGVLSVKLGKV